MSCCHPHNYAVSFSTCYLGNRLKLAICVMDQIHQSADSSRGVKIFGQSFEHARFSFGQPLGGGGDTSYPS